MRQTFSKSSAKAGELVAYLLFGIGMLYLAVTLMGFLSLPSPNEPIPDPYFSLMEILIILMAPLLILLCVVIHAYADASKKPLSLASLLFMTIAAAVTACVHYVRLYASEDMVHNYAWFFSFEWPSVIYALDIVAWDFFFALALLLNSRIFTETRKLVRLIRWLMLLSGSLSLAGLLGPVTANMQIRNIGILGYGIVFPVMSLFLGLYFASLKKREK